MDVSGFMHGITADRLGGGGSAIDIKGQLFAMTQRNSGTAPALWAFWDKYDFAGTELIG